MVVKKHIVFGEVSITLLLKLDINERQTVSLMITDANSFNKI